MPGEAAGSGSNPLYHEGYGDQWILHSTGIQIHDVLRVLRALRVKFFLYLRASAAPREIKSVLRALRERMFLFSATPREINPVLRALRASISWPGAILA